jgi:hypothetical protein
MIRKLFSSLNCEDLIWGPLSLLFSRYRGALSLEVGWEGVGVMKETIHLHILQRLRMSGAIFAYPYASMVCTGATLPLHLPVMYLKYFDVLLTLHLSIILAIDQLNAQILVL